MEIQSFPFPMEDVPVDFAHPNRSGISGLFAEKVVLNGKERPFLTYIPGEQEFCQPCFVAAIPSREDPAVYSEASGLKDFADRNHLFLHLAYAEGDGWKADGTDADYLNAVYKCVLARDYYITMQDNVYLCGIGDAAFAAHQAASRLASDWSGLMTFGDLSGNLQASEAVLAGEEAQGAVELKVMGAAAQMPVWMTVTAKDANCIAAAEYWKKENKAYCGPLSGEGADEIWYPTPVRVYSDVNEEHISQVRLAVRAVPFTPDQLESAWGYIGLARRHRGPGMKQLRYFKDPALCGAVRKQTVLNGMTRTWYEYVPEGCTPDKKWPLVFVFHGRGGTAETFFDMTNISNVAAERNFIAVIPEAGLYQQKPGGVRNVLLWCGHYKGDPIDDVEFVRAIAADAESRLPVDRSRIYAMGQSSGGMMSDLLSYTAGDLFAAVAPWSALRMPSNLWKEYPLGKDVVPTMMIYGDHDFLTAGKEPDPVLPFSLAEEPRTTLMEKLDRYGLDPTDYATWRTAPITWYSYSNGQGVPMIVIGTVDNMVHASFPEESWISYDQFLCKFRRDENGVRYYCGRPIRDPEK